MDSPYLNGHMTMLVLRAMRDKTLTVCFYANHNGARADSVFETLTEGNSHDVWNERMIGAYCEGFVNGLYSIEAYTLGDESWERDYTTDPSAPLLTSIDLYKLLDSLVFVNWSPHSPFPRGRPVKSIA